MFTYNKYLVKPSDNFNPRVFSFVEDDLQAISDLTAHTATDFRQEILFHSLVAKLLKPEWINANPVLVQLVTSKALPTQNIESLFQSCSNNPTFTRQLEDFLQVTLSEKTPSAVKS